MLPDTNVLLTVSLSDAGVAEVSDFMPVEDAGVAHNLVRRAKTVRGELRFVMCCDPRFDYARATPPWTGGATRKSCSSAAPARESSRCGCARRSLRWPTAPRSRSHAPRRRVGVVRLEVVIDGPSPSLNPDYVADAFKETVNFWRRWIARACLCTPLRW